jgi:ABC-type glycerol-3-phosphate transport system substrate-binding protein
VEALPPIPLRLLTGSVTAVTVLGNEVVEALSLASTVPPESRRSSRHRRDTVRHTVRSTQRGRLALGALTALSLVVLTACGGDDGSGDADGPVTVTVATFNEFGYEELIEEWNAEHDDIKIEQVKVGTWDDAKANLYTKLAAGSGLSDIEAIEGDAMPAILAESDAFADLTDPELDGRWLDWKTAAGTDADGRLVGYGTDIGPEGICYRADLFEKAGLPTDRAEVAGLMGTWDDYFALGEEFVAEVPETAWYDSSGGVAQAMLNQVENPFETDDNTVAVDNPELQAVYGAITGNVEKGLSTRLAQWSDDWVASFQNDGFATMACPGWMLGVLGARVGRQAVVEPRGRGLSVEALVGLAGVVVAIKGEAQQVIGGRVLHVTSSICERSDGRFLRGGSFSISRRSRDPASSATERKHSRIPASSRPAWS